NIYTSTSTNSKVLKDYSQGKILKFKTFISEWYEATVYVNGEYIKGYIHKDDVELPVEKQEILNGIATKSPTKVYSNASTNSKTLKSYSQGKVLKYKTFIGDWYEATVYVNGKYIKGYIHK